MNLRQPNANEATGTFNRSRSVVPMSGICTRCVDGCRGGCEIWLSTFRGREVLYPTEFGNMTAGADKNYPLDYSHLSIQGYAVGAHGLPKGVKPGPDTALFPNVDTETEYGWTKKVKMKLPIFTGALGSTEIARKNWEHFSAGAAIAGVTHRLRRERLRHRHGARARRERPREEIPRDGPPDRDLQALLGRLRRDPHPDERGRHPPGRCRVRHRQAQTRHDRAQVGPGRQEHRRRDQDSLAGARPGAQAPRLHRSARPDAPRGRGVLQGRRHQGIRAPQPPGLRHPGRLHEGSPAPAQAGLQAHHPQDGRLLHGGAGHGDPVLLRRQDRPAHDRRRPRRNGHEPLAHDDASGASRRCTCTRSPTSSARSSRRRKSAYPTSPLPAASPTNPVSSRPSPWAPPT